MGFRNHAQIIEDAGGLRHVAAVLQVAPNTVASWRRRNTIPAGYWIAFAERDWTDLVELALWAQATQWIWRSRR